jgi:hypothetical protein
VIKRLTLVILVVCTATAVAKPHKPPKPKPPEVELLTKSQDAALRQQRIKIGIESKQGKKVRVEAELVVEGIPEDFHFSFAPQRKRLRHHQAKVRYKLSRRQREVLAFGEQACMRADVNAQAKVGKRVTTIHEQLAKSPEC